MISRPTHVRMFGPAWVWLGLFLLGGPVSAVAQPYDLAAAPKLDLNTAPLEELQKLPGVGEATAKKIIAGRPYKSVGELEKAGVPKPTIEKLTPLVTVGAGSKEASTPEPAAKTPPQKGMVWVNTDSGIIFREGDRWYADNMWLFVPIQQKIKEFFTDFDKYPFQAGSSLNAAGINYQSLRAAEALKRLQQLENVAPPRN